MTTRENIYAIVETSMLALAALVLLAGCPINEKSPIGFRLPEGSIWKGRRFLWNWAVFVVTRWLKKT